VLDAVAATRGLKKESEGAPEIKSARIESLLPSADRQRVFSAT
jgi:hypothetical protein